MAQVAISASTNGEWAASASPTINTPAGSTDEIQILWICIGDNGGTVTAPALSGWSMLESNISGRLNRAICYHRVLSSGVSASTVSPTFSTSTHGNYYCASLNGTLASLSIVQDTSWTATRTIPATTATANNALHLILLTSGSYPRSLAAVSGYTEHHDDFQYTTTAGNFIAAISKAVSSGTVAAVSYTLRNEGNTADSGDQTHYMSLVLEEFPAATGTGTFTIDAEFPIPQVSITRTGSGSLAVGTTNTVTVTVVDQFGMALPNCTVGIGSIAGGVFSCSTPSVTDADGETSITVTAALVGTASLSVFVGTSYSNAIEFTVEQAVSNLIRRRRNRIWE